MILLIVILRIVFLQSDWLEFCEANIGVMSKVLDGVMAGDHDGDKHDDKDGVNEMSYPTRGTHW